jgi:ABC-type phosphate transport system substrate-binding protein
MRRALKIGVFTLVALAAVAQAADTRRLEYVLILNPATAFARLDRKFVAEIFLRRTTRWPDDTPVRPVDLGPDAPARVRFSQEILSRSVLSVRSYWQQQIFSGQGLPPPELADDTAVVSYVLSHPGAIGYVAAGISLNGARAVEVN